MVPVDEHVARRGKDIGSATLQIKEGILVSKKGEMMGLTLRSRPVLNASMVRNSKVEENVGRL